MDEYIGTISIFAGSFVPQDWALCDGRTLPIAQNAALFSILGTTYGGDGKTTFALPDLRGRIPIGAGQGNGLTRRDLGKTGGVETVTLTTQQIPAHTHTFNALSGSRESKDPTGNYLGIAGGNFYSVFNPGDTLIPMGSDAVSPAGGGQPHENMPPFLGLNYIICIKGLFPPRD
ncbi:MAG: phage tail protein [Spirosomataceae bacterium]